MSSHQLHLLEIAALLVIANPDQSTDILTDLRALQERMYLRREGRVHSLLALGLLKGLDRREERVLLLFPLLLLHYLLEASRVVDYLVARVLLEQLLVLPFFVEGCR